MNYTGFLKNFNIKESWIEEITLSMTYTKILHDKKYSNSTWYLTYALYQLVHKPNIKITFVGNSLKIINQFTKMINELGYNSNHFEILTSKIVCVNGSEIIFVESNEITLNSISSNFIFIDIEKFPTVTSQLTIIELLKNDKKPLNIFCSFGDISSSIYFKKYIEEDCILPIL